MKRARIIVEAGPQARPACLLDVPLDIVAEPQTAGVEVRLNGSVIPVEFEHHPDTGSGRIRLIVEPLGAGESRTYELSMMDSADDAAETAPPAVVVNDTGRGVEVTIAGQPFTTYHYHHELARPSFHPVLAEGGLAVTRGWPMVEAVTGESTDHPHHRGLWVAHGDVNGVDNWSEEKGHGFTIHESFNNTVSGPVRAHIDVRSVWKAPDGDVLLNERRVATAFALPGGVRVLDLEVHLSTLEQAVTFGDTKEGGICSVRVASTMDASGQGRIENADGKVGEAECWGKQSDWCDYSGPVQEQTVGVAILDHPDNFRHPTYWHVRDYGLMTANPFGISHFTRDSSQTGTHTVPAGETLSFCYRVVVHHGSAGEANIAGHYANWINPPAVRVEAVES